MKNVKIIDVATQLGHSRNTVSKAFADSPSVSESTKTSIINKALEMGYKKVPAELVIKYGKPKHLNAQKMVLVISKSDVSPFWSRIISGINSSLSEEGFNVKVEFINTEKDYSLQERYSLESNNTNRIAGIIVLSVYPVPILEMLSKLNVPIVFLDMGVDKPLEYRLGDVILTEGIYSVCDLVQNLAQQGVQRIGFIGDITYCRTIRDRYHGYLKGMRLAKLEMDEEVIVVQYTPGHYYLPEEVDTALQKISNIPEAFICANDDVALYLIKSLRKNNVSVPDEVCVSGYDNVESLIEQLDPFLTTVEVRHFDLGHRLAKQLVWRIDNNSLPYEIIYVTGKVLFRKSSQNNKKTK